MGKRVVGQPVRLFATALLALALALFGAAHAPISDRVPGGVAAWTAPDGGALELCLSDHGHGGDAAAGHDCPACTLIAGAAPPPAPPAAAPPRLAQLRAAPPTGPPSRHADDWRPQGPRGPPVLSA